MEKFIYVFFCLVGNPYIQCFRKEAAAPKDWSGAEAPGPKKLLKSWRNHMVSKRGCVHLFMTITYMTQIILQYQ